MGMLQLPGESARAEKEVLVAEDDGSSKLKGLVAKAKAIVAGGDGDDAAAAEDSGGAMGKVKAAMAKAASAVTGVIKKDDDDDDAPAAPPAADGQPTENASKMKAAVEAARKNQDED